MTMVMMVYCRHRSRFSYPHGSRSIQTRLGLTRITSAQLFSTIWNMQTRLMSFTQAIHTLLQRVPRRVMFSTIGNMEAGFKSRMETRILFQYWSLEMAG